MALKPSGVYRIYNLMNLLSGSYQKKVSNKTKGRGIKEKQSEWERDKIPNFV